MKNEFRTYHPIIGFGEIKDGVAHISLPESEWIEEKGKKKTKKITHIYMSTGDQFLLGVDKCPIENAICEKTPIYVGSLIGNEPDDQLLLFIQSKKNTLNLKDDIYDIVLEKLDKTIDFYNPDDKYIVAIWVIASYFFAVFNTFPYLVLSGSRGSGKTKVLDFLSCVAFNTIKCGNISVSAMFRLIEANRCTILLDEAEMLKNSEEAGDLKRIFNEGYKRGGCVYRTNKDSMQVESFQVYSPKAIGSINRVDETLETRGITISMIKTSNKKKGNVVIRQDEGVWGMLRDRLRASYLGVAKNVDQIYKHDESINQLNCRKNELWSPLLAVAKVVGDDVFQKLKEIALRDGDESDPVLDEWDIYFLYALKELLIITDGYYLVKEIKGKMEAEMEPDQALKLQSRWIGEALRRFGFTTKVRTANGYKYKIKKDILDDLFVRYQFDKKIDVENERSECNEHDSDNEKWVSEAISIFNN